MSLDVGNEEPKQVLELLAETKRLLQDRAIELRHLPGVESAQASLEATTYEDGPVLEGYLDVTFGQGDAVCWCIDVRWDQDSWTIEGSLDRLLSGRQKTLRELPVESANGFPEFKRILKRIVPELLSLSVPETSSDPRNGWPSCSEAKR